MLDDVGGGPRVVGQRVADPVAGAHRELSTVLGYVGGRVVDAACRRIPLARGDVGADGLITHPAVRAELAAVLHALP